MRSYLVLVLSLLFVVAAVWIGMTVYDSINNIEVNPNVDQHLVTIKGEFDTESLDEVASRIEELPVAPEVFHALEEE